MNPRFKLLIEDLDRSLQSLVSMDPTRCDSLPGQIPERGIYLFSEGHRHLYTGRSNNIRRRLHLHTRPSAGHNQATFAFRVAREVTGKLKASYKGVGSREDLLSDPDFAKAFQDSKARARAMDIRWVGEKEPLKQALLEIYVAVCLETPYNDFENH